MGPGNDPSQDRDRHRFHLDPPYFRPDGDLQEWRRKVVRWVDLIKSAAEKGTDRTYKTVYATLGRQLYDRGLPSAQQSILDEAQAKMTINFKQEDQIKAVRDIVERIAADPPIAMVSRLITSFNMVSSCRRNKNEELSVSVSRFHGLAAEHLMHTNATSQISEVLAITLLNNANLEEGTLTNAKLQLIALAEARASEELDKASKPVALTALGKLTEVAQKIFDTTGPLKFKNTEAGLKRAHMKFRSLNVNNSRELRTALDVFNASTSDQQEDSIASLILSKKKSCKLHLEDAVSVPGTLTLTSYASTSSMSMKDVENLVNRNVRRALLSVGRTPGPAPVGHDTKSSDDKNRRNCKP